MCRSVMLIASFVVVLVSVSATAPAGTSESAGGAGGWTPRRLDWGSADAINERGQIVGEDEGEAILWQNGKRRALTTPKWLDDYDYDFFGSAISDSGEIAGGTWGENRYPLLWQQDGAPQVLIPLAKGDYGQLSDINNAGQVVGWSGFSAVVWESGRPRALPGRACDEANGINDDGRIVGVVSTRCGQFSLPRYPRAVLWENGTPRILATTKSEAVDINNRGQVVGWLTTTGGNSRHGFLWENGTVVDLGARFLPEEINDRGQIVGSCGRWQRSGFFQSGHACVWQSGKITKLPDLGYSEPRATSINERQQIVGHGISGGGELRPLRVALVWTYKP